MRKPWIPLVLLGLGLLPIAVMWAAGEIEHAQSRIEATLIIGALTGLLILLWTLFLSPLSKRARVATAVAAALVAAFVRVEGTSGDLVPRLGLRGFGRRSVREVSAPIGALRPGAFPQFFGPSRDGRVEVALDPDWGSKPPKLLWRRELGAAWSGFAVEAGKAVTQEQEGPEELVTCYDLATGRRLWRQAHAARFETTLAGLGPRATPTIAGGRVYALGALGRLSCLDLDTGAPAWAVEVEGPLPEYGHASSPLLEGDLVIVQAGGPLAAYERATGARRWVSTSDETGYASPLAAELGGRRQVLILYRYGCAGHDPATGAQLWRYAWRGDNPKVAQPVLLPGDRVVISAGYGVGVDALRVTGSDVELLWQTKRLKAKMSSFVRRDGHLYGLDDGRLVCVDVETGERAWAGERYGHGQLLLAGDLLLISSEQGEAALVDADPTAFRERARLQVLEGKTWGGPALAGPYLLLRNDHEAACLELPLR